MRRTLTTILAALTLLVTAPVANATTPDPTDQPVLILDAVTITAETGPSDTTWAWIGILATIVICVISLAWASRQYGRRP